MKRIVALILAAILMLSVVGCGNKKSEAVLDVESKITNLGEITASSGNVIKEAMDAYDVLTAEEKSMIDVALVDSLNAAADQYDSIVSATVVSEIQNAPEMTLAEAYEKAFSIETKNEELLQLQKDLADLKACEGVFYQNGKYKTEVKFYLQYGEYWFDIDYAGYTGSISEEKVKRDGENGFLFNTETSGVHINMFTGNLASTQFEIRFGAEKMYISWGSSEYYLSRTQ